jgi:hypothetical protein
MRTRCAWCTSWTSGAVCERCTAEVLPPEQFGAARMLVEAGIDRLALKDRVSALSRNQFVALSSRFDAQWSILQKRADEARFVESSLLQRGFRERAEDLLIAAIPLAEDRLEAFADPPRADDLESIFLHSPLPLNRTLAAIALVRRPTPPASREVFEAVRCAVRDPEPRVAREAAMALAVWHVRAARDLPWLGRWDLEAIADAVRPLLADDSLRAHAALATKLASDDRGLEDALRSGLASDDPDLRFGCALALRDEGELGRALDGGDPLKADLARRTLGRFRSRLLHRRLAEDTDDAKLEIIKSLSRPAEPELIEALLAGAERARPDVRSAAIRYLYSGSFGDIPVESRPAIAGFLARASLAPEIVLKALDWGEADVSRFAAAATSVLEGLEPEQLSALIERHRWDLRRWFAKASGEREARLLDRWVRVPRIASDVLSLALDAEVVAAVIGVWDRWGADKGDLARVLAPAVARHSGSAVRDALVPAFWSRFKGAADAETRAHVMSVLAPHRYAVKELRSLEPRGGPFGSRDLARFYEIHAKADPLDAPELLSEALEQARQERGEAKRDYPYLAPLVDVAFPHAIALAATRPCTALRIAANLASHLVNAYREDTKDPALQDAVARMRAHHPALMRTIDEASPVDPSEARYSGVVEHLDTELRLAREADERLEKARAYEAERQAREGAAREAAARQAAIAEAERMAREAAALNAVRRAEERRPEIPREGIDDEPLLPDQPLRTLHEYVGFMKAISAGGDPMAMLSARGMTPQSWSGCALAWSALLQQRPQVAMRFAQLFQASR